MRTLVIEPLLGRGMRVRVAEKGKWIAEKVLDHGEDTVGAIAAMGTKASRAQRIVIRARVGSFSASRTAIVVATTLSATRGIPVVVVEAEIETVEALEAAAAAPVRNFDYSSPPNITLSKKPA